jgi:hypothetical protein
VSNRFTLEWSPNGGYIWDNQEHKRLTEKEAVVLILNFLTSPTPHADGTNA